MRDTLNVPHSSTWLTMLPRQIARWASQPELAALTGGLVFVCAIGGRTARAGDGWHLVAGLGVILATFLLVYLIQNCSEGDSDEVDENRLMSTRGAQTCGDSPLTPPLW